MGLNISVRFPFDQLGATLIPPLIVQVTVARFMGSLKFTQIGAVIGTFVCPLAGFVSRMNGAVGGQVHVSSRSSSFGVTRPFTVFSFATIRKYSLPLFKGSICCPQVV